MMSLSRILIGFSIWNWFNSATYYAFNISIVLFFQALIWTDIFEKQLFNLYGFFHQSWPNILNITNIIDNVPFVSHLHAMISLNLMDNYSKYQYSESNSSRPSEAMMRW